MASGKTHDAYVLAAAVLLGLTTSPAIAVGCVAGLILSPDLDTRSNALRRWDSCGLGWYWWPYRNAIRHRSPLSHWPVLGTLGRLLWLTPFLGLLLWGGLPEMVMIWAGVGLAIADTVHWVLDGFPV